MSRDGRRRRALTAAAVALPLVAAGLGATGTAAQANARQTLTGTKPAWAKASAERGKTASDQRIDVRVWLSGRDAKGLDAYAQAVSTPGSRQYRRFLTPQQFNQRFGATE